MKYFEDGEFNSFALKDFLAEKLMGEMPIRFNGHHAIADETITLHDTYWGKNEQFRNGTDWMVRRVVDDFICWSVLDENQRSGYLTTDIMDAWERGEETVWVPTMRRNDCHVCGERVHVSFNGIYFMVAKLDDMQTATKSSDPVNSTDLHCEFHGGMKSYTVEVEVPSGRLVFANDLRGLMSHEIPDHYINHDIGIRRLVEDTAKQGFLTTFVGNTCPSIYQDGNTLRIGCVGYDSDEVVDEFAGKTVGSICTDLWWFYAVDGDVFDNSTTNLNGESVGVSKYNADVVHVDAGRYKMTVNLPRPNDEYGSGVASLYATIEKIA